MDKRRIFLLSLFALTSVASADLVYDHTPGFPNPIAISLLLSLLNFTIELTVALIYLIVKKLPKKILISIFVANAISYPLFWFALGIFAVFFYVPAIIPIVILILEILVVLFEALVIMKMNKELFDYRKALVISLITNAVTVLSTLVVLWFLVGF